MNNENNIIHRIKKKVFGLLIKTFGDIYNYNHIHSNKINIKENNKHQSEETIIIFANMLLHNAQHWT